MTEPTITRRAPVSHRSVDQGSNMCGCHGERMCANVYYGHGVGCTLLYRHDGDHVNGFVKPVVTWPRKPGDWE